MTDTHAKMALDYGNDVTVAAAEFTEFDLMGSALLCTELQAKACNNGTTARGSEQWWRARRR